MSYAIGSVIYGIDLTHWNEDSNATKELNKKMIEHLVEEGINTPEDFEDADGEEAPSGFYDFMDYVEGYEFAYSGNGTSPCWFGIKITTIDECNNFTLKSLVEECKITPELEARWTEIVHQFETKHPEIFRLFKKALEETNVGSFEPEVHILWGSS